jgi:predicted Zn-dependent peptidase
VSHFLEHMCFKGTEKRPSAKIITTELDELGAQYNAFTGTEYTGYYVKGMQKNLEQFFDILSDIYIGSAFPSIEIEREKGVIIDEINMYEDMPARNVGRVLNELLYGDQPAGWSILGTRTTVQRMKRSDFLSYKRARYVSSNTVVIVAGDVTHATSCRLVQRFFTSVPRGKNKLKRIIREQQTKPAVKALHKNTDQTHLILGVRTFGLRHPMRNTLGLVGALLGGSMSSRLFQKLRDEMGVGYYVRASHDVSTDHGFLEAATGVTTERTGEVIGAIMEEFARLTIDLVSDRELKKAREHSIASLYMSLETTDSLAEYYGIPLVLHDRIKIPREIAHELRSITPSQVRNAMKKVCTPERLNLALIGPRISTGEFRKMLRFS